MSAGPPSTLVVVVQAADDGTFLARLGAGYSRPLFEQYQAFMRETKGRWNFQRGRQSAYVFTALEIGKMMRIARERKIAVAPSDAFTAGKLGLRELVEQEARKNDRTEKEIDADLDAQERARGPQGRKLYPFQRDGARFLGSRREALLCDEPGLGKTGQTLSAIPQGAPLVVVAPAVAKGVWRRELDAWRPSQWRSTVLEGYGSFRWPERSEMIVTSYEILDASPVADIPLQGTVLIADEAHLLKSKDALRTLKFTEVASRVRDNGGWVWLLTATPLLNDAPELYNLLRIVGLDKVVFGSYRGFVDAFGGQQRPASAASDRVTTTFAGPKPHVPALLSRVMLRRTKEDVLPELPPKTHQIVPVDLEQDGLKAADEIEEALKAAGSSIGDIVAAGGDVRRLSGRIPFELVSLARERIARAKVPAMLSYIDQCEKRGEALVVFSAHRAPVDIAGSRPGWAKITGSVSPEERTRIEDAFQAGRLRGVALTIKAGGVAITLTRACRLLFCDLEWTPALNTQAMDRVHRVGQKKRVIIDTLVGRHMLEERVAQLLAEKQELIDKTIR